MCVALREGKEAIFRFLRIAEQVCRFGLDFSEGKGTFNYTYIVIKALFLGMNWWQQLSNVWGFCFVFFGDGFMWPRLASHLQCISG